MASAVRQRSAWRRRLRPDRALDVVGRQQVREIDSAQRFPGWKFRKRDNLNSDLQFSALEVPGRIAARQTRRQERSPRVSLRCRRPCAAAGIILLFTVCWTRPGNRKAWDVASP